MKNNILLIGCTTNWINTPTQKQNIQVSTNLIVRNYLCLVTFFNIFEYKHIKASYHSFILLMNKLSIHFLIRNKDHSSKVQ